MALDKVGGQRHNPAALPPEKIRYPMYKRLGGPQDRSRRGRKNSLPPGFDPPTVQPVASHYIDWDNPGRLQYKVYVHGSVFLSFHGKL